MYQKHRRNESGGVLRGDDLNRMCVYLRIQSNAPHIEALKLHLVSSKLDDRYLLLALIRRPGSSKTIKYSVVSIAFCDFDALSSKLCRKSPI